MTEEVKRTIHSSQYIQSGSRITSWLENSKSHTEAILDNLPDIFAVVSDDGMIYKGNHTLAKLLRKDLENILGLSLASLFTRETWNIFNEKLRVFRQPNFNEDTVTFELGADGENVEATELFWTFKRMNKTSIRTTVRNREAEFLYIIGRDISSIRAAERKLSQVFSSLPIGMLQIDSSLTIVEPQSTYSEYLLADNELIGKTLFDVLYQPAWEHLTQAERESANRINEIIGITRFQFDFLKDMLLRKITFPLPSDRFPEVADRFRVLEVGYEPIFYDQVIGGVLITIQDRTEVERAKKSALLDALTGIPNRRSMEECLDKEWRRAMRDHNPLSIIFVDVDFFKHFNDNLGHRAGDECLQLVAKTLIGVLTRAGDMVARFGGEEFVAILPNTDLEGGYAVAERMRQALVDAGMPHPTSSHKVVTGSFGVAAGIPKVEVQSSEQLIQAADSGVYKAKEGGRNQVATITVEEFLSQGGEHSSENH